jgi:serine/threonine-protein phosphatase 2A regulatory subunit B'
VAHCIFRRERQRLIERYEGWQKMREVALKNAGDSAPEELTTEYPPPPPEDEEDLGDMSIDLSAAAMDAEVAQALDESGIERVPMADPVGGGVPMSDEPGSPIGQSPHVRRKSVLPGEFKSMFWRVDATLMAAVVDPTVLRDLQSHRSLDDRANSRPPAEGP